LSRAMRISFASYQPSDALALAAMCSGGRVVGVDCANLTRIVAEQVPH
jgi:hypothetical protein